MVLNKKFTVLHMSLNKKYQKLDRMYSRFRIWGKRLESDLISTSKTSNSKVISNTTAFSIKTTRLPIWENCSEGNSKISNPQIPHSNSNLNVTNNSSASSSLNLSLPLKRKNIKTKIFYKQLLMLPMILRKKEKKMQENNVVKVWVSNQA